MYVNQKFAPEVVNFGYLFAKKIAPKDTGALIKAIRKSRGKRSAKLSLFQPQHQDGRNRPYHLWMHGIRAPVSGGQGAGGGYNTSICNYAPRTGKRGPMFMFATREQMIKMSKDIFRKGIQKIK